ncbi:MAG: tyrosine-protein phosphatase, partial [Planctomycetes bacterium]|nr:tyrosine-protein phosphatase [Planctomycetota bacterium]
MSPSVLARWILGVGIATLLTVVPFVYYRSNYTHSKRLREVVPGLVYRSGQLTAEGFADAVARYHFRTIINLQDEYPDPEIRRNYFRAAPTPESVLCAQLGVRYIFLAPDLISHHQLANHHHPEAIDAFLEILANKDNYPVLLHCHAGLHRTGLMTAVYRMAYQGWSPHEAIRELKANGFGEFACTAANEYVAQYVLG